MGEFLVPKWPNVGKLVAKLISAICVTHTPANRTFCETYSIYTHTERQREIIIVICFLYFFVGVDIIDGGFSFVFFLTRKGHS